MQRSRSVLALSVRPIAGIAALLLALKVTAAPGEQIYLNWCAECHASAIGPGTKVLEQKYKGQVPAILQLRTGIPVELVKVTVRRGVGFMPPFRKTEISNAELDLLATYLSSVSRDSPNQKVESAR
jgi:mono/diheme cytochrome c family protein